MVTLFPHELGSLNTGLEPEGMLWQDDEAWPPCLGQTILHDTSVLQITQEWER